MFILWCAILLSLNATDAYDKNCVKCHASLPISLEKIFMQYLAAYGGKNNVKVGLDHYFRYPAKDISVMPSEFLNKYGVYYHYKNNDNELKKAIDIYWEKYKVIGRLK
ncbi:MAG: hypothetical protein PHE73_03335 [Sulfurovaceae bacterium]|nr:hypothetical protein [Sulfurovaceae bacterium]